LQVIFKASNELKGAKNWPGLVMQNFSSLLQSVTKLAQPIHMLLETK
jgi:hypothetical protein